MPSPLLVEHMDTAGIITCMTYSQSVAQSVKYRSHVGEHIVSKSSNDLENEMRRTEQRAWEQHPIYNTIDDYV